MLGTSRVCSLLGGGQGEERRSGLEGVLGLGLDRGLKGCCLELGGWGEKLAVEPEEGDNGDSRTSGCCVAWRPGSMHV